MSERKRIETKVVVNFRDFEPIEKIILEVAPNLSQKKLLIPADGDLTKCLSEVEVVAAKIFSLWFDLSPEQLKEIAERIGKEVGAD